LFFSMPPPANVAERAPRADNRLPQVRDAAARLFREKGYAFTSMRDIAAASGMLAGSLYYHFASKDELLVAVYAEGVCRISQAVEAALLQDVDPWTRLERVCAAHLAALLEDSDYGQVVIRVRPDDVPAIAQQLVALRDGYEKLFARAIAALPLPSRADRRALRLMLLGALNWSQTWYRSGHDNPQTLARRFVSLLRGAPAA
jgi:AcrR family transcriptional regulator